MHDKGNMTAYKLRKEELHAMLAMYALAVTEHERRKRARKRKKKSTVSISVHNE